MKYESVSFQGKEYKWSAFQDSEHPDFVLVCEQGEIWVQVLVGKSDFEHNQRHFKDKEKYPITSNTALKIIAAIVELGYIDTYFTTDVGLYFDETGRLIEN